MKLVDILSKLFFSIILTILFYLIVTPIAFLQKIFGTQSLNIKFNKEQNSYWIVRNKNEFGTKYFEKQ